MPVGAEDGAPGEEPPPAGQHLPSRPGPRPILLPRLLDEVAPQNNLPLPRCQTNGVHRVQERGPGGKGIQKSPGSC